MNITSNEAYTTDIQNPSVSANFAFAKGLSILVVLTGHYFTPSILWVPTTVALIIFAFSSGAFSVARYGLRVDLKKFWRAKVYRLGFRLIFINTFLLLLFLLWGANGLLTWQTPVAMAGLSGILNWFGIPNPSPLGAGGWFLTLLLLFYAAYPLLANVLAAKRLRWLLVLALAAAVFILHSYHPMGHMLWLTAFGFVFGVFWAMSRLRASAWSIIGCFLVACLLILIAEISNDNAKVMNFIALSLMCVGAVQLPFLMHLPRVMLIIGNWLSAMTLEIYLIHTYLFIHPARYGSAIGYLSSVVLILAVAQLLHWAYNVIYKRGALTVLLPKSVERSADR